MTRTKPKLLGAHDDEPVEVAAAQPRRSRARKPYQRLVYTEPEWQREEPTKEHPQGKPSVLIFRGAKTDRDDQLIEQAMQRFVVDEYDADELKAAAKDGTVNEFLASHGHFEMEQSFRRAYLAHQLESWSGPEFILDDDYEDDTQDPIQDEVTGQPMTDPETERLIYPISEFAGKVPPPMAEWLNVMFDGEETTVIWRWLQRQYAGGGAEAQETFRGGSTSVARS